MLTILDLGPDVLGYRAEGRLERDDIERVFAEVDRKLAGGEKIRVYGEVQSLDGISLDALWQDLRMSVQRWNAVSRIEKAALVTDIEWLRKAAIWEDKIFRGIHVRTFPLAEQAEAQSWIRS